MNISIKEPVYIIIPVHNRKQITLKCLDTLNYNGDLDRYYVIVVDDGSTDGTSEAIHSLYPDVIILRGDGNLWWTGAIKKGMEYASQQGAEYFIWLNDDCLLTSHTLQDLLKFSRGNSLNIVGCQGYDLNSSEIVAFGGKIRTWKGYHIVNFPKDDVHKCDMLSGNVVCLPHTVIEHIGYPNPSILPHYGGDSLFLIRARKAGFKIFVDTRNPAFDILGESKIAPKRWLLQEGEPLAIFKLIFNPHSLLSWRVWFNLYFNDYDVLGIFIFLYFYVIQTGIFIVLVTVLRCFPISIRNKISTLKRDFFSRQQDKS